MKWPARPTRGWWPTPQQADGERASEVMYRRGDNLTLLGAARRDDRDQWPWEPPRTTPSAPNRRARLQALGNAVVPVCAEYIGHRLYDP